ncbi:MAG: response regulator transcription factor [Planctomycetes bacterium]|nr:response regulator transcription factor [Planctomycetota bacterium]
MDQLPVVYVIDDDPDARQTLVSVVVSMRLEAVSFTNASEFLAAYVEDGPCCLVTDLRMQGMSGLDLLRHLRTLKLVIPTIIVTGYAETPIAVDAMHAGAVTFLEKTAPQHKISMAITEALHVSERLLARKAERDRIVQIWDAINPEERRILKLVGQGKLNKEIAFEIGAALRTIEDRRRRLMAKIGAESIADLIRFAVRVEELEQQILPDPVQSHAS